MEKKAPLARQWRLGLFSAAAILAVVAVGTFWWHSHPLTYTTHVGEQRSVALGDGSTVVLNTNTIVQVKYSDARREIRLQRGEALFQVAQDAARPFIVRTAAGSARAVGTRFNVIADEAGDVTVSVLEGRVEVIADAPSVDSAGRHSTLLNAGESAACARDGSLTRPAPGEVTLDRIAAWREGKLRFDGWPLDRAVREYNRYADKPVVLDASADADVLVSGMFRIGDSKTFVDALVELIDGHVVDEGKVLRLTTSP
jgi:transmembrane sensor